MPNNMNPQQTIVQKDPTDPSVWNPSANVIRNVDLELIFYGYEECFPLKCVGPTTKGHYKIHYVHSGKGLIKIDNRTIHVSKGQCFVFYPDDYVYYEADSEDPWIYSWVAFDGSNAEYYLKRANISNGQILVTSCNREVLEKSFNELMHVDLADPTKDMKFISLLYIILSALQIDPDTGDALNNMRYPAIYVKTAIKYIQDNYAKDISIADVAAFLSLDRKYFSRIFKEHLQVSPNAYIMGYRMMKACELLDNTTLCINEIAQQVGYENPFSFSRAFKSIKNMSPDVYRKTKEKEKDE